jgi:hypothetical protein
MERVAENGVPPAPCPGPTCGARTNLQDKMDRKQEQWTGPVVVTSKDVAGELQSDNSYRRRWGRVRQIAFATSSLAPDAEEDGHSVASGSTRDSVHDRA